MKPVNRDQFFFKMRDGELAEAKKVHGGCQHRKETLQFGPKLPLLCISPSASWLRHLAKIMVRMGVDLGEIDRNQQTALFLAASRGITTMVRFLLNLGFEDVRGKFSR